MGMLFFVPLTIIAVYENHFDKHRAAAFLGLLEEQEPFTAADEDPEPQRESDEHGTGDAQDDEISKVPFDELKKSLPDLSASTQGTILKLVKELQKELEAVREELKASRK